MEPTRGPLDQLDVPLVWDRTPGEGGAPPPRGPEIRSERRWSRARLWTAALADLGVVLLTLVAVLLIGVGFGIALAPPQLAVSCAAAVLVVGAIGTGALWGWRATPGMLLLGLQFRAPLAVGRAQGVWVGWMCALAVAGLPLLVGRRGRTVAEQLGGCEIVSH